MALLLPPLLCVAHPSAFAQSISHSLVYPLMAPKLSSVYGKRSHPILRATRHHDGVDLAAPENSHVRAVAPGIVIFAQSYAGYGKLVSIRHAGGFVSIYGHLSTIRVKSGEKVPAGQIIGTVGSTGLATGPHLHFEWRQNGKPLDPLKVFPGLVSAPEG